MKRKWRWLLVAFPLLVAVGLGYVRTHPLVFMGTHAHCITFAGLQLERYAGESRGALPVAPQGVSKCPTPNETRTPSTPSRDPATMPPHSVKPKRMGKELDEEDCSRVYVQGLTKNSNPEIAILFDKLPTPGRSLSSSCPLVGIPWSRGMVGGHGPHLRAGE